jgi:hypothetical protein
LPHEAWSLCEWFTRAATLFLLCPAVTRARFGHLCIFGPELQIDTPQTCPLVNGAQVEYNCALVTLFVPSTRNHTKVTTRTVNRLVE